MQEEIKTEYGTIFITQDDSILNDMSKINTGDRFECESRYYEIVRGYVTTERVGAWVFYKKSTNLLVKPLRWKHATTRIKSVNTMLDIFEFETFGNAHKLLLFKKHADIIPFKDAELRITWKSIEERDEKRNLIKSV